MDRSLRMIEGVGPFQEENGPVGGLAPQLHGVIVIIFAHTDNLGGLTGGQQAALRQRQALPVQAEPLVGGRGQGADGLPAQDAPHGRAMAQDAYVLHLAPS